MGNGPMPRSGAVGECLGLFPFALNALVDLLAVNLDIFRGFDPDPYLGSFDRQYRDHNFLVDDQLLAYSSGQYQHYNYSCASSRLLLHEAVGSHDLPEFLAARIENRKAMFSTDYKGISTRQNVNNCLVAL